MLTGFPCLSVDLMTAASLVYTAVCIINIHAVNLGFGRHVWDLAGVTDNSTLNDVSEAAEPVQMMNYTGLILSAPVVILAKTAVIILLLRIFPDTMRALRYFLIAMAAVLTACCLSQAFVITFQCWPVQASWRLNYGACFVGPLEAIAMGLGAVNIATDLAICITPIPFFWRLSISKPQKLCVCAVFMTGLV